MTTTANQGYVPTEDWPDVTAMLDGFGAPSLAATAALEGEPVSITLEDGQPLTLTFSAGEGTITTADNSTSSPYRAVEARRGIYLIDLLSASGAHSTDTTILLNTNSGQVKIATSRFIDRQGTVRMETVFLDGQIDGHDAAAALPPTEDLVGKRIYYKYSPTEHYEHIYLNRGTFVWHCIRGAEVGLADVDPVQMWRVDDELVLLHWSETVMPVESIVLIDLQQRRSIGRMFCWDGPTLDIVHIPFDSQFEVLNDTHYPTT